ncbi:hypothetical protein Tco_1554335 [Tanacetum coccineum]
MQVQKSIVEEEVREFGIKSLGDVSLDEFGGADANLDADESPFDTETEIKFIGKEQEADSDLESVPGDEIESLSGFEADVSEDDDRQSVHKEELTKTDEAAANNVIDEVAHLESSLAQLVADKIKDSVPRLVADAFKERVPELLSDTLKNILSQIIKDTVKEALLKFDNRVKKTLNAEIPELLIKPLYNAFNLHNKKEHNRFLDKNAVNLRELVDLIRDLVFLIRGLVFLDSGCSRHMIRVKQYLHKYSKESGMKVVFRDNSSGDTEGYGSINCNIITFIRVAYVNVLTHNLISISQLCDANFKVLFTKTKGTIFNQNNKFVLIAPRRRDVYVIDMSSYNEESYACIFAKASNSVNWLWHKCNTSKLRYAAEYNIGGGPNGFKPWTGLSNSIDLFNALAFTNTW